MIMFRDPIYINAELKTPYRSILIFLFFANRFQGRRNEFQSKGAMEIMKSIKKPLNSIVNSKKNLNSRRSRMAKTLTFWPWWQPFNSEMVWNYFFFLFPFFSFCYAKKCVCVGGGASPLVSPWYCQACIFFKKQRNIHVLYIKHTLFDIQSVLCRL